MPYIGRDLNRGNYLKLDDISSSFNSSTTTFNLTVGGSAFTPGSAFSILVSVGGVIQEPESAYQVENSEITFANAPTAQDSFFCLALGVPIGIGVPGNGTVNGTQMAKPFNYDGFFFLDDANNRVGINSSTPTVALDVDGIIKASSFTGGSGGINAGVVTCTGLDVNGNGDISGNLVLGGDLTVNGTTTTLDTNLIGVDRIEVGANSSTVVGVAITQSGTADLVRLYDGTTQVVTVDDEGNVGIASAIPSKKLDVVGDTLIQGQLTVSRSTHPQIIIKDSDSNSPGDENGISFRSANNTQYGFIGQTSTGGHTMLITTTNTVNPIRLQVNSSTNLEVGYTGVYVDNVNFFVNGGYNAYLSGEVHIADSLIHQGDTDTKIRFPAADTITAETGGSERIRISSNGRIGIGTDTNLTATVNLHGFTNPNAVTIKFSNRDSSEGIIQYFNGAMYIKAAATTGDKLIQFQTSGSSRLTIDPDGDVLVGGHSAPLTTYQSTQTRLSIHKSSGSGAYLELGGNQTTNGTSAGTILFVNDNNADAANNDADGKILAMQRVELVTSDSNAGDDSGGDLVFMTKPEAGSLDERLRIFSDGRVQIAGQNAIAATSLTHRLLVRSQNDSNAIAIAGRNGDHIGELSFYRSDASTKIGDIEGHSTHLALVSRAGYMSFATGGATEKLRIDSSGRLLVGLTSDPAESSIVAEGNSNSGTSYAVLDLRRGQAATSSGNVCGYIRFSDTNIDSSSRNYAWIAGMADGTSSSGSDNPGRLVFATCPDNSTGLQERLRIDSAGRIHTGNPASVSTDDFNITALGTGATLSLCRASTGNASDGDLLGAISFQSYPAGQAFTGAEAAIRAYAETGQSGSAAPTSLNFYTKPSTVGPGGSASERLRISSDGQLAVNFIGAHHTSVSGIFAANATTSGRFSYKAIEIGTAIASGTDQGALIVARRKASSSSPATLVGSWDDGTDVTFYYGGGWGSHAGSATRLNFYTDTYSTGNNNGGTRLSIGSKGQIFLNNRDSNNSSHRGNIIAYAPISGEFSYKSLEIGSMQPTSAATGGLIVSQRKGTTAYPFAMMGSWDDGSNCNMYYGGGWGSQSANATIHRFYTGSYQGTNGSSGTEVFTIDNSGNLKQQRISSGGSGFSYFTGSSEYVFGSTTSSPSSGGAEAKFQIHDYKTRATLSISGYMNNAGAPFMQFISSRSGTVGTLGTKAANGDYHGDIRFMGDNGTNYQTLVQSASIMAKQVSTISDGDTVCGGELQFYTGNNSAGSVTEKFRIQNDGKIRYGLDTMGLPGSIQGGGFMMYANNGSNNITRLTFTGLVSGCYIATIGYYNAAGQGMGGAMFFVSGYQTANHTYDIHEVRKWDGASNSAISGVTKSGSNWYIEITNTHGSYNGGGEVNLYGDGQATFAVTYRQ